MSGTPPKKPPKTDEDYEEIEYVPEEEVRDEDDDDDEAEFVPGDDDNDDDDVEDDEEEEIVPLFDGVLSVSAQDQILHYRGEGFHLSSVEAVKWNMLDANAKRPPDSDMYTIQMEGPCDVETGSVKRTHRKLEVTWSLQESPVNGNDKSPSRAKKGEDEEEDEDEAKAPSIFYRVYGRQIEATKGEILEFRGGYSPPSDGSKEVGLVCQVRIVKSTPNVAAASGAAGKPVAAAAAARVDTTDEDDDDDEADQVDYDELIALHEDAGLSVDALRKRYRGGQGAVDEESSPVKRRKPMPDDDDDDYGF